MSPSYSNCFKLLKQTTIQYTQPDFGVLVFVRLNIFYLEYYQIYQIFPKDFNPIVPHICSKYRKREKGPLKSEKLDLTKHGLLYIWTELLSFFFS